MVKNKKAVIGFVFLAVILLPLISSSGVATPYWDENPLKMAPGESATVTLSLQNMVGGEDINVEIDLIKGSEIARLVDNKQIYTVPFGRKDIPINIELKIPENPQREYEVDFIVKTINSPDGKQVQLSTGLEKVFKIIVKDGVRPAETAKEVQTEAVQVPAIEEQSKGMELIGKDKQTIFITVLFALKKVLP